MGGGRLRDILLGAYPLAWVVNLNYLYIIIAAVTLTFLFKKQILLWRKTMFLFDTIVIAIRLAAIKFKLSLPKLKN